MCVENNESYAAMNLYNDLFNTVQYIPFSELVSLISN